LNTSSVQRDSAGYASLKTTLFYMVGTIVFYSGALAIADWAGHAPERLTRDPAAVFDYWPLYGSISQVGVLLMAVTSAICLFTAVNTKENRGLMIAIGLFSVYFLIDDDFMLHETFFPALGIREKVSLLPMAFAGLWIFWHYRTHFLRWDAIAIWLSGGCLATSIVMDGLLHFGSVETWIEDGFKFAGLAMWAFHWVFIASHSVRKTMKHT
jgi:hypothetical protein